VANAVIICNDGTRITLGSNLRLSPAAVRNFCGSRGHGFGGTQTDALTLLRAGQRAPISQAATGAPLVGGRAETARAGPMTPVVAPAATPSEQTRQAVASAGKENAAARKGLRMGRLSNAQAAGVGGQSANISLGGILSTVGRAASGFIPGGGVIGSGLDLLTRGFGGGRASCGPGFARNPQGTCVPSAMSPTPGARGAIERFLPGGASGFQPAPAGMVQLCPSGMHLNKSNYFTSQGFVPKGSKCVRNRSRNNFNGRAITRAASRLSAHSKAEKRVERTVKSALRGFK